MVLVVDLVSRNFLSKLNEKGGERSAESFTLGNVH